MTIKLFSDLAIMKKQTYYAIQSKYGNVVVILIGNIQVQAK